MRIPRTAAALSVCSLLVFITAAGAQDVGPQATDLRDYYSANGLLQREMYDLAVTEYRTFLDAHPSHAKAPTARYGLSVCLFRLQRHEEAVSQLKRIRGDDDFAYAAEVATILGQCHLALGNFSNATASFGEVVRKHPEHDLADDAAAGQAEALYRDGKFEQVKQPCETLVSRWPDSPHRERAELFWGLADMAQREYAQAAQRFEATRDRFPTGRYADQISLLLGQSLHRSSSLRQAAQQYRRVIDTARREYVPDALYGLAVLEHGAGELEPAGERLDRLLEEFDDHTLAPAAQLLRGRVWFDLKEESKASALFEKVAELDGEYRDDAVYWLAKCDLRRDEPARAAARLTDAIATFPESELLPEMTYDRAVALLRAGEPDEAIGTLRTFRSRYPEHALAAGALHLMAMTEHQQRRYDSSVRLCREFEANYSDHELAGSIAFLRAENLFLAKNYQEAAEAFTTFLGRYPDDTQASKATYRLGMSQYHRRRFDESAQVLADVVDGQDTPSEFASALLAVGDINFQRGEWEAAERDLGDYLSLADDQPSADDALLKLGLSRARQDRPVAALEVFDELIERFPQSAHHLQGVFERGQALTTLKKLDDAAVAFEQVLAQGPDSRFAVHALNHLGSIAVNHESYVQAASYFQRAAGAQPTPQGAAESLFQQGQALMSAKHYEQAATVLAALIRDHRSHERVGQAAAQRSIALARQGEHATALAEIERVEREHGANLQAPLLTALWYEKAWCLRELDRTDEAAATYRKVLAGGEAGPLRNHALLELAELEAEAEQYSEAAERLRALRAQADQSDNVSDELLERATYRLGVCEFRLENLDGAITLFEEFLDRFPDSTLAASASLWCGEALFKTGGFDRAVTHLRRVVENHSSDEAYGPSLLRLGESLAVLQRWKPSEDVFRTYLAVFGDTSLWFQAQFGLAWAMENQQNYEDALPAYEHIVQRHQGETAARAQFQMGECLFAMKRLDEAVRELLKVDILYAYPQWSAAALYEAGRCFQEMGNPTNARKQFEQVRTDHGQTRWAQLAEQRLDELSRPSLPGS